MPNQEHFTGDQADLTEKIIKVFYAVANELGPGFLESVYRKSMLIALAQVGLKVQEELPIQVSFRGCDVSTFSADLVVDNLVILELKATDHIAKAHETQLLNYLRSTSLEIGLLLAFGDRAAFRRVVMSNDRKRNLKKPFERDGPHP